MNEWDAWLDREGPVRIGDYEYYPSDLLKHADPQAYEEGLNEFTGGYHGRD